MLLWITLGLGIANFYMHRAVMEGDGPMFEEIAAMVRRIGGRYGGYILEFALLVAALWFARQGSMTATIVYGGYTLMNVTGYQLIRILERR
ncbi:MAG: hypothetical protein ABR601_01470 [Parasphingopyxis sp.]